MAVAIQELAPGYFKFVSWWDEGKALYITLTLIGPDGIKTTKNITWKPVSPLSLPVAVQDVAEKISAVQSWRAVANENELSVGVADPAHYSGTVTLEII